MISPDLPITKTVDDKLNRSSFARNLAQILLQDSFSSSFTIGIYGEWGSGKTSLLNMVLETVESINKNAIILRFNPWLCSDTKQLITQFFKQMATAIKLKKTTADRAWELIDQYADIFDAASLIPGAGTILKTAGKTVTRRAREHVNQQAKDLQKSKNQIIEKMAEENLKIIVSIDDIDRLSEEEIIAVFQVVKALADFPNTVYLLAFDYDVVVHALSKIQHGNGKEYLEKIIQVLFEIPAPSIASIHEALFSKLNDIIGDISEDRWDKATWTELFQFGLKEYIRSIRDVIRYSNVFFLKYELLKEETNLVDLLGLTCLQVFEPTVYSKLPNYKDILCGENVSYSYEQQKADEEKVREAIDALIPDNEESENVAATKKILGILFPRTRCINGSLYAIGRYYAHKNFFINNNIAVSACFDRYFSLTLENEAISTSTIKRFIYDANESELIGEIERLYQEGKIERLLEEIEAYANQGSSKIIPTERACLIIQCLARQWDSFKVDDSGFFSIPFAWRLLLCVNPLLKSMDSDDRYPCIYAIFQDQCVQLSTLVLLLNEFENQHGRFTEASSIEDGPIITLEQVSELEQIFKTRAIKALDSWIMLKQYDELNFLWLLEKIDAELVASRKKKLVADDISLVKVLSYCTSHGRATTERTVSKTWRVDEKTLEGFIEISEAYQRIQMFTTTDAFLLLPEDEQQDVAAFLLTVEQGYVESTMDHYIFDDIIRKKLRELTF